MEALVYYSPCFVYVWYSLFFYFFLYQLYLCVNRELQSLKTGAENSCLPFNSPLCRLSRGWWQSQAFLGICRNHKPSACAVCLPLELNGPGHVFFPSLWVCVLLEGPWIFMFLKVLLPLFQLPSSLYVSLTLLSLHLPLVVVSHDSCSLEYAPSPLQGQASPATLLLSHF